MNLLLNQLLVLEIVALNKKERRIVLRADQTSESANRKEFAAPLTMLDNATNLERVIEQRNRLAHRVVFPRPGKHIIHDHVIFTLKRAAGHKHERLQSIKAVVVDTPDRLDRAPHRQMLNDRGAHQNMRKLAQYLGDLRRNRRPAHTSKKAAIRWANNQVGADT